MDTIIRASCDDRKCNGKSSSNFNQNVVVFVENTKGGFDLFWTSNPKAIWLGID